MATEAALRAFAEAQLLPHSRPEAYTRVASFPLTSSGKVHRHGLAQIYASRRVEPTRAVRTCTSSQKCHCCAFIASSSAT